MTNSTPKSVLADSLQLVGGFRDNERAHVLALLTQLDTHLARWQPDQVDVRLSVKERDKPEQYVRLEAKLGRWPVLVAKVADAELDRALQEARGQLIRSIEEERTRRTPKDNRKLRRTLD